MVVDQSQNWLFLQMDQIVTLTPNYDPPFGSNCDPLKLLYISIPKQNSRIYHFKSLPTII